MLVYDKIEVTEGFFNIVTEDMICYSEEETDLTIKQYYILYGSKAVKVKWLDQNLTQYFIYGSHPV